jgi:thiol-disulfide isomerase/thioredoxin/YHS domain-containing protein
MSRAAWLNTTWLTVCGFLLAGVALASDTIPWMTDYRQATQVAARERRLVLLHFWSDDCPPCRRLEANVFPRPEVAAAVAAGYVPVKVHIDQSPELARRYQVTRWPTDVIVTPAGLEVYRTVSPQEPARYAAMLTETAARSGAALARTASPAQGTGTPPAASATQPVGYQAPPAAPSAVPSQNDAALVQPPMIEQGTPVAAAPQQNPYAGADRVASQQPSGPALAQNGPYQPTAPVAPSTPPQHQSSPAASNAYSSEFLADAAPPAAPAASYASGYGAPTPGNTPVAAAPTPQMNPYTAPPVAATPPAVAAAPTLPPVGLEGYCPVTLAEEVKWVQGDKRFGAVHRGKLYLFTSDGAQRKFLAEPDRFSPVLSGFDPVRFAESGKLVDGKRAHGLTYNNQVYLFTDEESLRKFQTSPRPFADTVYQAMIKSDSASKFR